MTILTELRDEAAKQPDGSVAKRLLTWAEIHFCDSAEQIDPLMNQAYQDARTQAKTQLWMTPNVPNGGRSVPPDLVASKGMTADGQKRTVGLESQTKHWPTPSASVANDRESPESWNSRAAKHKANGVHNGLPLTVATAQWPTPASRDAKGTNSEQHVTETGTGRKHMDQLPNFVAYSPQAQTTPAGQQSSNTTATSRRALNPIFATWLMGWPLAWTIAEPSASSASATALWRSKLQQRLSSFFPEHG